MQGNTLQGMLEIAAASYWVSAKYVATDPLRVKGDYQAVPARIAEMIGTSKYSYVQQQKYYFRGMWETNSS